MLSLSFTTWCVTSLIITIPLGLFAYFRHLMRGILKNKTIEGATDYERDLVYLHQFPRWIAKQVPNMSPFALKLETWLRLRKIKYKVVPTLKWSNKGQSPFIYFNGQQIADSNMIMMHLCKYFGLDPRDGLSDKEWGASRALRHMVESSLVWTFFYFRYTEHYMLFAKVHYIPLPKLLANFIRARMAKGVKKRCYHVGIGRLSTEEMYEVGLEDIRALSCYLGDNHFMCGSKPTAIDCCVFGHLAQVAYVHSLPYPHRELLEAECPNLLRYLDRVKTLLWPDWDEVVDPGEFKN